MIYLVLIPHILLKAIIGWPVAVIVPGVWLLHKYNPRVAGQLQKLNWPLRKARRVAR